MEVEKGRLEQGILTRFHLGVNQRRGLKLGSQGIKVHDILLPAERKRADR
jgi:hypothetical protein